MGPVDVFVIVGLVAASVEEWTARGRAIGWWGVIAICVGLLLHLLNI